MAEFIFARLARSAGLEDVSAESAATSGYERGNPVYAPARRELARHGIDCAGKVSRQAVQEDYARFDHIYAMDRQNLQDLRRLFGDDPEGKLTLFLTLCGEERDVSDPWYTGDFSAAYRDIEAGCAALVHSLKAKRKEVSQWRG